jgi:hypothetical protein
MSNIQLNFRDIMTSNRIIQSIDVEPTINALQLIHSYLIKCIKLINNIFGFQAMLCVGISDFFTFFTLFSSYKSSSIKTSKQRDMTLMSIYWCLYLNTIKTIALVLCCLTENQNYETSRIINRLISRNVCDVTILKSFGNQVVGQSSKSSCGLFYFDFKLFGTVSSEFLIYDGYLMSMCHFQMFSTIVYYLIIFVQFEMTLRN